MAKVSATMKAAKKLADDLREAVNVARYEAGKVKDDGTSNLDSVKVRVPRKSKDYLVALLEAGFRPFESFQARTYNVVSGSMVGQAERSRVFCETVRRVLREKGHDANVEYMID